MSRGVGSLLLVFSIAVLAAVAFGVDASSAKVSRSTACGGVPNTPPNDPDGVLAKLKLTPALKHDYTGWNQPIMASAWSNWKPKGKPPYKVAMSGRPHRTRGTRRAAADPEVPQAEPAGRQEPDRDDGVVAAGRRRAGAAVQLGDPAGRRHHPQQPAVADGSRAGDRGGRQAGDPDGLGDQHRQLAVRDQRLAEHLPRRCFLGRRHGQGPQRQGERPRGAGRPGDVDGVDEQRAWRIIFDACPDIKLVGAIPAFYSVALAKTGSCSSCRPTPSRSTA